MEEIKIINTVGGHDLTVYTGAEYDASIRKYRGGEVLTVVPYSGKMLSAKLADSDKEPIHIARVEIPTKMQVVVDADEIPDDGNLYVVSALYLTACRQLGRDTSRLLTIGGTVVDDTGRVIGCAWLNRN